MLRLLPLHVQVFELLLIEPKDYCFVEKLYPQIHISINVIISLVHFNKLPC